MVKIINKADAAVVSGGAVDTAAAWSFNEIKLALFIKNGKQG